MTPDEQLNLWVDGKPVHNDDRWYSVVDEYGNVVGNHKLDGGECCPDFSCCRPELLAPPEVRRAFRAASLKEREKFLSQFLAALLELEEKKVHIAGAGAEQKGRS